MYFLLAVFYYSAAKIDHACFALYWQPCFRISVTIPKFHKEVNTNIGDVNNYVLLQNTKVVFHTMDIPWIHCCTSNTL